MKSIKSALVVASVAVSTTLRHAYARYLAPHIFNLLYVIQVVPTFAKSPDSGVDAQMVIISRYSIIKKALAAKVAAILPKPKYAKFTVEEGELIRKEMLTLSTLGGEEGVGIILHIIEQFQARQAALKELDEAVTVMQEAAAANGEQLPTAPTDITKVPVENVG